MYIAIVNCTNGERDNYPNVLSVMPVSYNEVVFNYMDLLGSVNVRRVKLDTTHQIEIYV